MTYALWATSVVGLYLLSLAAFITAALMAAAGMQSDGRKADCWTAVVLAVCAFGMATLAGGM